MCPEQGFAYLKVKSISNEELMNLKKKKKNKQQDVKTYVSPKCDNIDVLELEVDHLIPGT